MVEFKVCVVLLRIKEGLKVGELPIPQRYGAIDLRVMSGLNTSLRIDLDPCTQHNILGILE